MKYSIVNSKIYCGGGRIIDNGYIVVNNGKIAAVGNMKSFSAQGKKTDKKGCIIIPGLIDAHNHVGMVEDSIGSAGDDLNETSSPVNPQLKALDAVNIYDRCFADAYKNGITSVVTGPGSASPIAGQLVMMKTYGKSLDDMVIKEPCALKIAFGENPKKTFGAKGDCPQTRMAVASLIRQSFYNAIEYEKNRQTGTISLKDEALLKALRGEIKVHIHAHRADDILTALRIVKEFNLKAVLVHCTEGYKITEQLNKYGVKDILTGPIICDRSKPELLCKSNNNTAILDSCGFNVSVISDHPELPVEYLRLSAMLCIKDGLSCDKALDCITINPAKAMGVDNRTGSIDIGKDADFVVLDGEPFDFYTNVLNTYINGECVYSR